MCLAFRTPEKDLKVGINRPEKLRFKISGYGGHDIF